MNLSRRGFLGSLLAVVSAPAIVRVESLMALPAKIITPEPVLWLMGEKTTEIWTGGNNLLTIDQITREAVCLFVNSNAFIKSLDEQYDREFAANDARIGDQLRIRLDAQKMYSYNSSAEIEFAPLKTKTPWTARA